MNNANIDIQEIVLAILDKDKKILGTGFLVTEDLVVTCGHVVSAADAESGDIIQVRFENNKETIDAQVMPAEYLRDVESGDIAVLKLKSTLHGVKPLRLGYAQDSKRKAPVSSFGYAIAADEQGLFVNGEIDGYKKTKRLLQIQAKQANFGISGAPVLDENRGLIIGMITKGDVGIGRNQFTTFATPTEILADVIPGLKLEDSYDFVLATPPRPVSDFIGREKILTEIKSMLVNDPQSNIIAITGMGGVGKTSLATQIANDMNNDFNGNVFWGDLSKVEGNAIPILRSWAEYCGYNKLPVRINAEDMANQVRGLLEEHLKKTGAVLVVIDDIREGWLEDGEVLRSAVPANIPIVITTRETVVTQSLKTTKDFNLDEYPLSDSEAENILIARSTNKINLTQSKIIAKLCEKMPLALGLAALVARSRGAKYLLEKLSDKTKILDALKVGSRKRKDLSVRITFEISYNSLSANAALVFRYLGAFAPNTITAPHLTEVLIPSKKRIDVAEELFLLQEYSLLQKSDYSDEESPYRMHALLHEYAQTLLKGKEATEARQGHFAYFQNFAKSYAAVDMTRRNNKVKQFEILYPQMMQALVNFEQEYKLKNSRFTNTQLRYAIELINILDKYWSLHDSFGSQVHWLGIAYHISAKLNLPLKQADFARRVGRAYGWQGELNDGIKWMKRCEVALGDNENKDAKAIRAQMYVQRASLRLQNGSLGMAEKDCISGLKLVKEKEQPRTFAEGHNILGVIKINQNKLSIALEAFEKSLAAWKLTGDEYQTARVLDNVRSTHYLLGDIAKSRAAIEEGLKYWEQFPYRNEYAAALTNRGLIYYVDEDHEIAIEIHKRAMEIADSLGYLRLSALTRVNLAWPYISLRRYDEAETLLNNSLKMQEEHDVKEYQTDTKRCLAELEVGRGNYAKAIELAEISVTLAHEDENSLEEGAALRVLGQAYHLNGDLKQAGKCLKRSLLLLGRNGYKYERYLTLQALAVLPNEKKAKEYADDARILSKKMGLKLHSS